MGVESTQSAVYTAVVKEFEEAIEAGDELRVSSALKELGRMLHPGSPMRKVFALQAASLNKPSRSYFDRTGARRD